MERTKENLNTKKLRQFIKEETHLIVHDLDVREDEVIITADVEHGPDPDEMREKHGIVGLNRGTLRGEYSELHEIFFQPGDYNGELSEQESL